MPDSFSETPAGLLLVANGIDKVLRWDGFKAEMEPAGVIAPATALSASATGSGALTGTYYAYTRYYDEYGNFSALSPLFGPFTASNNLTITYTSVPIPVEPKVVGRQILRNTTGQTLVFYVDIDTTDLTSTSFQSTKNDTTLATGDIFALIDSDGRSLAFLDFPPPDDKKCLASHLDRLFLGGEEEYKEGCVVVTATSTSVTGIGTEWPLTFAGRFLWVEGADKPYEISEVNHDAQTILLMEAYGGSTDPYARYSIRPPSAQRRLVAFSEAGLYESWPPTNAIAIQEDGDQITGLMVMDAFLYILERRHAYRCTFQDGPLQDGAIFLSITRGCVNHRCFAVVDDGAYLLDESGCHFFDGGREAKGISLPIQDVFEPDSSLRWRIRWSASRWFHCVYDPGARTVRWFVTLEGTGLPRHALVFDIQGQRWWMEEYPFPIGHSCVARVGGRDRVVLAGPAARLFALGVGSLDAIDSSRGTVRGTATGSSHLSLSDQLAWFDSSWVGSVLSIVDGKGKGQTRLITSCPSFTMLRVATPWLDLPDTTSVYQVGGVHYQFKTGWFRWAISEKEDARRLEVLFDPLNHDANVAARIYYDRSKTPREWDYTRSSQEQDGMASLQGDPDLMIDLTKPLGFVQRRLDEQKEMYIDGPRLVRVELEGRTNKERVTYHSMTLDGAEQ